MTKRVYGNRAQYARVLALRKEVTKLQRKGILDRSASKKNIRILKSGEVKLTSKNANLARARFYDVLKGDAKVYKLTKAQEKALRERYSDNPSQIPHIMNGRVAVKNDEIVSRRKSKTGEPDVSVRWKGEARSTRIKVDNNMDAKILAWFDDHPDGLIGFEFAENPYGSARMYTRDPDDLILYLNLYTSIQNGDIEYIRLVTAKAAANEMRRLIPKEPRKRKRSRKNMSEAQRAKKRAADRKYYFNKTTKLKDR